MQAEIAVTITSVTLTKDTHGDSTEATSEAVVEGVLFAPRTSTERSSSREPAVVTGGTLYKPGGSLNVGPNDRVTIDGVSALIDGAWQVDGEAGYWGVAGTEVAIIRAQS